MKDFYCRTGTIPGISHLNKKINNQDAFSIGDITINGKEYLLGVVSDGCTGVKGSKTEVGSILLTQFIISEMSLILSSGMKIADLPQALFPRCIGFFRSIAGATVLGQPEVLWDFIQRNLLCTVIGFAMDQETGVVFNAGDGVIITNENVKVIDQDNVPQYLAYNLVDRAILGRAAEKIKQAFDVVYFKTQDISRLAISTDGLADEWKKEQSLIDGIWNYESSAKAGLQWWLNIQSSENKRFRDDCTIVAVNKIRTEEPKKKGGFPWISS